MSSIEEIVPYFQYAKRIMVFTGAGMSTDSGIPDFRSKQGIYKNAPETILSKRFFFENPTTFYDFFFEKMYYPDAKPSKGHQILAKWQEEGRHIDIITQNMDGLHQLAGNEHVVEFHGSIHTATCYNPKCQKKYTMKDLLERKKQKEDFYICDCTPSSAKRYIKPDVVLFDEAGKWMSSRNLYNIRQRTWIADVILVLGSSLKVYPFAGFIDNKPMTKPMVIINNEYIKQENKENTYAIHQNISETLSQINEYL